MKRIIIVAITLFVAVLFACGTNKTMTPENFIQIQDEFIASDQTEEVKEQIAKKYGFSAKQYDEFEAKVESDADLKAKLGEIRLQGPK